MEDLEMLEVTGKSVDEAVFMGITQMGLALDEVSIEIIEETTGFLGMGKKIKVRLTKKTDAQIEEGYNREQVKEDKKPSYFKENYADKKEQYQDTYFEKEPYVSTLVETNGEKENAIKEFLQNLTKLMSIEATVHCQKEEDGSIKVELLGDTKQVGSLIGYRGEVLDSLQHITSLSVNKDEETYNRIILDVEGYRHKREQTLVVLAKRMAQKAQKKGKVVMEPMNPYERRILHATLQDSDSVTTYSEGEEPLRRVIIVSKDYTK